MPPRIDLTGKRFSHLLVIESVGVTERGHVLWECLCDCGNKKTYSTKKLREGVAKSCGCMQRKYSHGKYNTRLYHIWCTLKARCLRQTSHKYPLYGGRGIKLCEEWLKFEPFYEWAMANGYDEKLSIDRIDNNGNYCPENCRWATPKEQANNTRSNRFLTLNGETHTMAEWSEITGITSSVLHKRLSRGWSTEDTLTTPLGKKRSTGA